MHSIPDEQVGKVAEGGADIVPQTGGVPDEAPAEAEAPELINFKEEVIGYIEDELAQGYGLDQIIKGLLAEGYPEPIIDFASEYVASHHKINAKEAAKEKERTDDAHHKRRFHVPMMGVVMLILTLLGVFFYFGIGSGEEGPTDIILKDNLGITLDADVGPGLAIYDRDELVQKNRAGTILEKVKENPLLANLAASDAFIGVKKKATVYSVPGGKKTLVEIRFQSDKYYETLKILESIPKDVATSDEIDLTQGGVLAEEDPILLFTYNNVKEGSVNKIVYVIDKEIATLDTVTFPVETIAGRPAPRDPQSLVCGDGKCEKGENYRTCCEDCGCLPGFECLRNRCAVPSQDKCQKDSDCDDSDKMTRDVCSGTPKTCQNEPICVNGDAICPDVCTFEEDDDCEMPEMEEPPGELPKDVTGVQESPEISGTAVTPDTVGIGQEIKVSATVTDANGKQDIARVWFEVLELYQTHGEIEDMNDAGSDGDSTAGDDVYTATRSIGDHYLEGYYHITIYAQDKAGNKKKQQVQFHVTGEGNSDPGDSDTVSASVDCGTNMDCMIAAADGCNPATATHTASISGDGMIQETEYSLEITGTSGSGCGFEFTVDSIDISYTEAAAQDMIDSGMTSAEVTDELAGINSEADLYEGEEGICVLDESDLISVLSMWVTEDLDVSAWDVADCSGNYFTTYN